MAFITLIIGAVLGFIGGMIVSAGDWRNALAKLGAWAIKASQTPPAHAAGIPEQAEKCVSLWQACVTSAAEGGLVAAHA